MNHCLTQIISILDKLQDVPAKHHLALMVDTVDDNEKLILMNCITRSILRSMHTNLNCISKKNSNIIHIFKIDPNNKMDITIDYTYIIHNPFKIKVTRMEYMNKTTLPITKENSSNYIFA